MLYSAAGSEASPDMVITNDKTKEKLPYSTEKLYPKFSVLNPRLTCSVPPYQTAAGCTDMIIHVMERYFTNVPNVELSDRLCESVIKTVLANTPKVLNNPDDYDARAEVMWSGSVAHNNLLTCGRIGDWASHDISILYQQYMMSLMVHHWL